MIGSRHLLPSAGEQSLVLCREFPPNVLEEFLSDLLES